jgi:hypothetical protein
MIAERIAAVIKSGDIAAAIAAMETVSVSA